MEYALMNLNPGPIPYGLPDFMLSCASTSSPTPPPPALTARYNEYEDLDELLENYGFQTIDQLRDHVESLLADASIPNVRYSYGVKPYPGDSNPDPRIGSVARRREEELPIMRRADIQVRRRLRPGCTLLDSRRKMIAIGVKLPELRTDNEETWRKTFDLMEAREEETRNSNDLKLATRALTYFNMKFKTEYVVEETLGTKLVYQLHMWYHCNFVARSRDGSQSDLFFAEFRDSNHVTLCCIVDGGVRGCNMCGEEFVHPREGGLQVTGWWPKENVQNGV